MARCGTPPAGVAADGGAFDFELTVHSADAGALRLVPRIAVLGGAAEGALGSRRWRRPSRHCWRKAGCAPRRFIRCAASTWRTSRACARVLRGPRLCVQTFSAAQLAAVEGRFFVVRLCAERDGRGNRRAGAAAGHCIAKKQAGGGVTMAAMAPRPGIGGGRMNKVYVVGLGPGGEEFMTAQARAAMERADVLCGYTVYGFGEASVPGQETYVTPMTRELERCRWALKRRRPGARWPWCAAVTRACTAWPGRFCSLQENMAARRWRWCRASPRRSRARRCWAPLMHDFCVISLSDLLTPWEQIERRLALAAAGDFSICLYNPSSKKRADYLRRACDILLREKSPDTVCGWVRNIGRRASSTAC